jgi:hypothetical protein
MTSDATLYEGRDIPDHTETATVRESAFASAAPNDSIASRNLQELRDLHEVLGSVVERADAKASMLLALVGLALGATITILATNARGVTTAVGLVALGAAALGAIALSGSVVLLVIAVRPVSWVFPVLSRWVSAIDREFEAPQTGDASAPVRERLSYVKILSRLVRRKHCLVAAASTLVLIALPFFGIAAIMFAVAA